MKFVYQYRTSDNVEHQSEIDAPNREAAFSQLKVNGIKPAKMWEKPGLANLLFGKGKRWIAIVVLTAVATIFAGLFLLKSKDLKEKTQTIEAMEQVANPTVSSERHQIWGDEAVIEQAIKTNWKVIFPNPADRLLSLFAQPGFTLPVFPRIPDTIRNDFTKALSAKVEINDKDLDEYKQMKMIVEGMKEELRTYIKDGGTLDGYLKRLVARQKEETAFVDKAKKDLDNRIERGEDAFTAWQETNRILREQGLKSIPMPSQIK